jgi:PST family polysaccharide transporter
VGQLAAIALGPLILIPLVIRAARRSRVWPPGHAATFDTPFLARALEIGAASLVSGLSMQGALYFVRWNLEAKGGPEANGQFQAAYAIGSAYLGVLLAGIATYLYPRYANASDEAALEVEVNTAARFISALAPPIVLLALAFSDVAVHLLYSSRFETTAEILKWQLAGDAAKCLAWVYAGPLLFRGRIRAYVGTELVAAGVLALSAWVFIHLNGLVGIGQAYLFTYVLYLPIAALVVRVSCGVRPRVRELSIVGAFTLACGILSASAVDRTLMRLGGVSAAAIWLWRDPESRAALRAIFRSKGG